jgi:orotate phosphoribosyltransferase|tara:strand:- start:3211 stop:3741 length:531 start_codon:yes stop_codon:yes gene_type:complete
MKNLLLDSLKKESILKGEFVLSSGEKSNYYIDARISTLSSISLGYIADIFYKEIIEQNLNIVGGPSIGADPIVGAILEKASRDKNSFKGFLVRSADKEHGTKKKIEGPDISNKKVVIVEDVVSTGGSILRTIDELDQINCKVELILSIVDREMGAKEKFLESKISYNPIFKISELL